MRERILAVEIIDMVMRDLHARKGIGNELEEIDAYVYKDMVDNLIEGAEMRIRVWQKEEQ